MPFRLPSLKRKKRKPSSMVSSAAVEPQIRGREKAMEKNPQPAVLSPGTVLVFNNEQALIKKTRPAYQEETHNERSGTNSPKWKFPIIMIFTSEELITI